jgi:hypothetical protein
MLLLFFVSANVPQHMKKSSLRSSSSKSVTATDTANVVLLNTASASVSTTNDATGAINPVGSNITAAPAPAPAPGVVAARTVKKRKTLTGFYLSSLALLFFTFDCPKDLLPFCLVCIIEFVALPCF